jgi:hypothetical protein
MGDHDFDFEALKALKVNQYKKEQLKPVLFKKCKGAIIFTDYKMAGKKTPCIIVPFKKLPIAAKTFKTVKKDKEHLLKKTAFASLAFSVADTGKTLVTISLLKGGLSPEVLTAKAAKLFGEIKMDYTVLGIPEEVEAANDVSEPTDDAAALRKQATSLAASFKNFVSVEWAAVKQNSKSAKVIMAANNKGRSIATKMSTWLSTNTDNADAAIEVTAVRSYADKLNTLLDQIKPSVDKINQSTEGSGVTLEGLSVDISDKINRLLQNYAVEIDQVEQLKEALDALK